MTLGALFAGLAVAAGAFAAHGLDRSFHQKYAGMRYDKKMETPGRTEIVESIPLATKYLADFKTGAEYQMYHGLALIFVGLLMRIRRSPCLSIAGTGFLAGILGFSGGLYAYTLTNTRWVGMAIVPLGGVCFLVGWVALTIACCKTRPPDDSPANVPLAR